jgi:hypothetical protein
VVSQSDLVKLLWEHKEALELAKTLKVEELGLVYSAVFTVSAETTALEAYHHMCMDCGESSSSTWTHGAVVRVVVVEVDTSSSSESSSSESRVVRVVVVVNSSGSSSSESCGSSSRSRQQQ